jgi:hypothetical protein
MNEENFFAQQDQRIKEEFRQVGYSDLPDAIASMVKLEADGHILRENIINEDKKTKSIR